MPKSIRLLYCGLVINVYSEEGAPHHMLHVEVAKEGGREYKANFAIQSCELLSGKLESSKQEEMIREIIATYRQKLLNDWRGLNRKNKTLPKVLVIKDRRDLLCGLAFWPILRNKIKCIAVSYRGSAPPAVFDFDTVQLLSPGNLQIRKQRLAEKAIMMQKPRWSKELENYWENLESYSQLSIS